MGSLRDICATALVWLGATMPVWADANLTQLAFVDDASGRTLNAWMSMPASFEPAPAALFLHGCSGLGEFGSIFRIYRAWADIIHQAGYAVLMIDSAGSRGFGHTCGPGPERSMMYRERPSDAYAGLSYLQSLDGIDDERIFLVGWSQGGGIALLTMNTESIGRPEPTPTHDFRAAAALYPAACAGRWQTQPYTTVEPGTWRTVAPIIILQGAEDNWTPPEPCLDFVAEVSSRGEPVEIVLYPDAVHAFDAPDMPLRRREGVITSRGEVPLVGTNEDARSDAVQRLISYFAKQ